MTSLWLLTSFLATIVRVVLDDAAILLFSVVDSVLLVLKFAFLQASSDFVRQSCCVRRHWRYFGFARTHLVAIIFNAALSHDSLTVVSGTLIAWSGYRCSMIRRPALAWIVLVEHASLIFVGERPSVVVAYFFSLRMHLDDRARRRLQITVVVKRLDRVILAFKGSLIDG